jgi:hypothetical protein
MRQPSSERPFSSGDSSVTPWTEAGGRLAGADTYWLTTVGPDGRPHVRPVLAVWVAGALHFCAGKSTRKAKNLAGNPRCVIATVADAIDLVVEGEAAKVDDDARLRSVAGAYASKYDWHVTVRDGAFHDAEGAPTAGPPPYDVYEVAPARAFGFGTDGTLDSTRWRF